MLKPLIIGFPALLLCLSLAGQQRNFTFGVHGGAIFTTVEQDPELLDPKFRTGFFAGANARFAFTEHWAVQGEVQYAQRGYRYNSPGTPLLVNNQLSIYTGRVDQRISYVDIIAQVEFCPVKYLGIALGPYLSWKAGEAIRFGDVIDWTDTKDNGLIDDGDLGISAKLSGHLGPVTLFVSWMHGMLETTKINLSDENGNALGQLTAKNRALAVGAAYRF